MKKSNFFSKKDLVASKLNKQLRKRVLFSFVQILSVEKKGKISF